jgi:hypothetical protein
MPAKNRNYSMMTNPVIMDHQTVRVGTYAMHVAAAIKSECNYAPHPDINKDSKITFLQSVKGQFWARAGFRQLNGKKMVQGSTLPPRGSVENQQQLC